MSTDSPSLAAVSALGSIAADRPEPALVLLWCVMTVITASAAILTRYCRMPASSIGLWRVFGAAVVLSPVWLVTARRNPGQPLLSRGAILAGIFLGAHFATWCWALLHAHVANAALFIAMQPAITPLAGRWLAGDRLNRWEYAGTAGACAGMLWIIGGQVMFTPDQLPGSIVACVSTVCCAIYFVLGRHTDRAPAST